MRRKEKWLRKQDHIVDRYCFPDIYSLEIYPLVSLAKCFTHRSCSVSGYCIQDLRQLAVIESGCAARFLTEEGSKHSNSLVYGEDETIRQVGECPVNRKALHLHEVWLLLFKGSSGKCFSLDFTINPKSLQVSSPSITVVVFHLRVTTGIRRRPANSPGIRHLHFGCSGKRRNILGGGRKRRKV